MPHRSSELAGGGWRHSAPGRRACAKGYDDGLARDVPVIADLSFTLDRARSSASSARRAAARPRCSTRCAGLIAAERRRIRWYGQPLRGHAAERRLHAAEGPAAALAHRARAT